jgi:hypothetical protein
LRLRRDGGESISREPAYRLSTNSDHPTVPFAPSPFTRRVTRVVVLWLMATLLPLQSSAAAMLAALGPAHMHRQAPAPLVLEDFRRWKALPVARRPAFATTAHVHAGLSVRRHHHVADDASVVPVPAAEPAGDEAAGAGSVAALALIPASAVWRADAVRSRAVGHAGWRLQTGFAVRRDRPPKQG